MRKYENARQLYEYVMSTWPDSKDAIWAGAGIIRANIDLGNDPNVPEAVDELLQQFSGSEFIAEAVFDIAGNYYDVGKYENALELYEYAISTWPDSKNAIWAGAGIIRANIVLGNDLNVPEAVDELLQQFSESEFIADALRSIADSYCEARKYEKAIELHQYTLQTWPDSKDAIWARAGIIRANIALGNDPIALGNDPNDQQLNELFPDFSEHPELPEAIFDVAGQYYKEAFTKENVGMTKEAEQYFQKAIILWETIPTKLPEYPTTANAFHFAARCYERLGKYDNAIEHFETVLRDWPGYQYAWSAQFLIGRCYRRLEKAGVISKVEADTEIRIVYEQLLQDYPNCPAARAAQDWFDHNN